MADMGKAYQLTRSEPALVIEEGYSRVCIFIALTYLYSWAVWGTGLIVGIPLSGFFLAGGFGPVIAALLLTGLKDGKRGIGNLVRRLFVWRVQLKWYFVALFWMAGIRLLAIAVHVALGGNTPFSATPWAKAPLLFLIGLIVPLAEEPGWRGFALPRLLSVQSPLGASISVGLVWAVWHFPLFWIPGTSYFTLRTQMGSLPAMGLFALSVIALSILFTYLFLRTNGSLLIAFLFHDAVNTSSDLLTAPYARADILRPFWLSVGIMVLVALVVITSGGLNGSLHRKGLESKGPCDSN
jgi:uncharacterized protein